MERFFLIAGLLLMACLVPLAAERRQESPTPLARAHAHNDYEHKRPLQDALEHGFCSVEADIYLVGGQLLVAHDRHQVDPRRTLQDLYLDPLRERAKQNGGRIHPNGPSILLLIDIKSDAETTYETLRDLLRKYSDVLTTFTPQETQTRAITVIVSGNRPRKTMAGELVRYAALDGRLGDLDGREPKHLIPLISDNWTQVFKWRGLGPFPAEERKRLREVVEKAHEQGRTVRFWATPDEPAVWKELLEAKVDLINTDHLAGLQQFLLSNEPSTGP